MALKLKEARIDHNGVRLPEGIYAMAEEGRPILSYKVRWREEDENGVSRNRSKSFSARQHGSLDGALEEARAYREAAVEIVRRGESVLRPDRAARMTVDDLFKEWCALHASTLSERRAREAVRLWHLHVASRGIARVRLGRLAEDPSMIVRFHDQLIADGMSRGNQVEVLKLLRAVLRWGRRRHPNVLALDLTGLFKLPTTGASRLAFATDAYALERLVEAARTRRARNPLLPLRDAALIAAMGFTVATRPSEWLHSVTWADIHATSVEIQKTAGSSDREPGMKTGARAALLLPNARDRILAWRDALEAEHGAQPDSGLVFQALSPEGPLWWPASDQSGPRPVAWTHDDYKHWTARVWRPVRAIAAQAPDCPAGIDTMRFYDCRHTAISLALHSTLIVSDYGMNLHNLAGWAGHDVMTLQRYYAHLIARYQDADPIDLKAECDEARKRVAARPFTPPEPPGPQRAAQRRRRNRARAARVVAATG